MPYPSVEQNTRPVDSTVNGILSPSPPAESPVFAHKILWTPIPGPITASMIADHISSGNAKWNIGGHICQEQDNSDLLPIRENQQKSGKPRQGIKGAQNGGKHPRHLSFSTQKSPDKSLDSVDAEVTQHR